MSRKPTPDELKSLFAIQRLFVQACHEGPFPHGREPANFSGLDLSGLSFAGLNLYGCDFRDADLTGCDFTGCNLQFAKLRGNQTFAAAKSEGADLRGMR